MKPTSFKLMEGERFICDLDGAFLPRPGDQINLPSYFGNAENFVVVSVIHDVVPLKNGEGWTTEPRAQVRRLSNPNEAY